MGLGQEGVEMQWVPGEQAGPLLCRQTAESFLLGHAHVLQPPRRVCPSADIWLCPLALTEWRLCVPHHLLTPYHPSPFAPPGLPESSAPCAVRGETRAAWSLQRGAGRTAVLWMGRLLGHPLDSITRNS